MPTLAFSLVRARPSVGRHLHAVITPNGGKGVVVVGGRVLATTNTGESTADPPVPVRV